MNEYDELLARQRELSPSNEYDDLLRRDVAARLRGSLHVAVQQDPSKVVEHRQLSGLTGLPVEYVAKNEDAVKREVAAELAYSRSLQDPVLNTHMARPEFAAIAHDDIENLGLFAKNVRNLKRGIEDLGRRGKALAAGVPAINAALWGAARALSETVGVATEAVVGENVTKKPSEFFAEQQRRQTDIMESLIESHGGLIDSAINDGLRSLGTNLPFLLAGVVTGAPGVALLGLSGVTAGLEYGRARDKGVPVGEALTYGLSQGVVEYATEKIPVTRLIGDLKAGIGFWRIFGRQMVSEQITEQVATVLQDLNEWAVLHPEKTLADYLAERPSAAVQTAIATLVGVGGNVVVMQGVQNAAELMERKQRDAERALANGKILSDLVKLANASQVRSRDPEAFRAFLQDAARDGEVTELFVNLAQLEQAGVNLQDLATAIPSIAPQISEARVGVDARIPIEDFLALAPGSAFEQALIAHAKVDPHAMSPVEADAYIKGQSELWQQEAQKVIERASDATAVATGAAAVQTYFEQQLSKANRFTPDVNRVYASLMRDFFVTMGARVGLAPEQMLERYVVNVQANLEKESAVAKAAMAQEEQSQAELNAKMQAAAEQIKAKHGLDNLAVWLNEKGDLHLGSIIVPTGARGQGRGTAAMQDLVALADASGLRLTLTPANVTGEGPVNTKRLTEFYQRFGFVENKGDDHLSDVKAKMYREPSLDFTAGLEQPPIDPGKSHRREKTSGRYVGAPSWVGSNPRNLVKLRRILRQLAREGEVGRFWYENSSRVILRFANGDANEAEVICQLIAIYSPTATVPLNTSMALTAYYQWKAGLPIAAGYSINDVKAEALLRRGEVWEGVKTNSFYQNLMVEIDPDKLDPGVATMDMWMTLAFGYPRARISSGEDSAQYKFMLREIQRLADELGWKPHQAQAAIWVAMRARVMASEQQRKEWERANNILETVINPKTGRKMERIRKSTLEDPKARREEQAKINEAHFSAATRFGLAIPADQVDFAAAAYDFSDALAERSAQLSWEVIPSKESGVLPGVLSAPIEQQREYHRAVLAALTDERGRDAIAAAVGLPAGDYLEGFSAWEGKIGVGGQNFIPVAQVPVNERVAETDENWKRVPDNVRELMDRYAALRGYVLNQQGVVWHFPVYDGRRDKQNGFELRFNRPLTQHEMEQLYNALNRAFGTWDIAPGYTAAGARILNFTDIPNKEFRAKLEEVTEALTADGQFGGGLVDAVAYRSDGNYVANDWKENRNGEAYLQILAKGGSDLLERAAYIRARVEAVNDRFAREYGWDDPGQAVLHQARRLDGAVPRVEDFPVAGREAPGGVDVVGVHFSSAARFALDSSAWGQGKPDAARAHVSASGDPRLAHRIYFYVPEGGGVAPEPGVGALAHGARLTGLYDLGADPLSLVARYRDQAKIEAAVLDAGYAGVYLPGVFGSHGGAILLGPQTAQVLPIGSAEDANLAVAGVTARGAPKSPQRQLADRVRALQSLPAGEMSVAEWRAAIGALDAALASELERIGAFERAEAAAAATGGRVYRSELARQAELGQGGDEARGSFSNPALTNSALSFSANPSTISLLRHADLSTFLHEAGHFFLEVMIDVHDLPGASPSVARDVQTLMDWFGVKDVAEWRSLSFKQRREHHEKFARGFERYLFEGEAPSVELRSIFSKFRSWLLQVYKSLTHPHLDVQLTDEVREVFDRMLAAESRISKAEALAGMEPLFKGTMPPGMTLEEWAEYQSLAREASEEAVRKLETQSVRAAAWTRNARSRALKAYAEDVAEKRAKVREEVEAELRELPIYRAMQFLKNGEFRGQMTKQIRKTVEIAQLEGYKLSLPALKEMYGDAPAAPWRYLPVGKHGMVTSEGGLHPDVVAELFGFDSGDALVRELLATEPLRNAVEAATDARMLERYGEIESPEAAERAALQAIHNEARARFLAAELKAISRAAGPPKLVNAVARTAAENIIARRRIRDIRPAQFYAAAARSAREASAAMAKADTLTAALAKRNQVVSFHGAREAERALRYVDKSLRYFERVVESDTIDRSHRDQIEALLERFDLRRSVTAAEIERRKSLLEWVEEQRALGVEPTIDKDLLNEAKRQHYSTLTYEEFRGLVDAVRNIEHLGRLKHKLLLAKDQREFEAHVTEIVDSLKRNATRVVPERRIGERGLSPWAGALWRGFLAMHRKFTSYGYQFDGFKDGGVWWEHFVRTMNERGDYEATERAKATQALTELFKPLRGEKFTRKIYIPEVGSSFTLEEIIGVALNMGNEINMERVLTGERWTPSQLEAVLSHLEKKHWDFVQSIWDYFETFRPAIAEKEKRVNGVEPTWVEAMPVQTKHGVYRGGYYPIKYDPLRSSRAEADTAAEVQRQVERGLYARAQTLRGHLEERAKSTGRAMRYDFATIVTSHVNQVIHDLAWHEWLIDVNRLINNAAIDGAIRTHYGSEVLTELRETLKDIAIGELSAMHSWERAIRHVRHGATIAGLGWNLVTSALQPLGLTQAAVRIGPVWLARGLATWLGDAARMENTVARIQEKSEFMRNRMRTLQREVNEIINVVENRSSALQVSYFFFIAKMQLVADVPTWLGAYQKAIAAWETEDRAVAIADQAVRASQGTGTIGDLARVQRGGEFQKLWTNFYSYFNTTYNLMAERTRATDFKNPLQVGKLAVDYLLLIVVPATLGAILRELLKGDLPDDEDEMTRKIINENIGYLIGLMVGLREAGSFVSGAFGYQGPAGARFFSELAKLGKQVSQGELDEGLVKAAIGAAGTLFHFPATQINRLVETFVAAQDGQDVSPLSVVGGVQKK